MGFDFIVVVLLLASHGCFFFVFGPGLSLELPCRPVDGHSAAYCSFGALGGGERTSSCSTVLNQNLYRFLTADLRCPLKRAELESLS